MRSIYVHSSEDWSNHVPPSEWAIRFKYLEFSHPAHITKFVYRHRLLKVKVMQDCDLAITGFEEGQGANAGTLGAVLVDYKGSTVGVGSGFTKEQRDFFWQNRNSLLGRVITVQYFEETTDAKGVPSLRFPVFRELREEGKEASLF